MPQKDKTNKPVIRFKDFLLKNMGEFEDVKKNTSSNDELSMMRFLMRQRNQFRR